MGAGRQDLCAQGDQLPADFKPPAPAFRRAGLDNENPGPGGRPQPADGAGQGAGRDLGQGVGGDHQVGPERRGKVAGGEVRLQTLRAGQGLRALRRERPGEVEEGRVVIQPGDLRNAGEGVEGRPACASRSGSGVQKAQRMEFGVEGAGLLQGPAHSGVGGRGPGQGVGQGILCATDQGRGRPALAVPLREGPGPARKALPGLALQAQVDRDPQGRREGGVQAGLSPAGSAPGRRPRRGRRGWWCPRGSTGRSRRSCAGSGA